MDDVEVIAICVESADEITYGVGSIVDEEMSLMIGGEYRKSVWTVEHRGRKLQLTEPTDETRSTWKGWDVETCEEVLVVFVHITDAPRPSDN